IGDESARRLPEAILIGGGMHADPGGALALHGLVIGVLAGVAQKIGHGPDGDLSGMAGEEIMGGLLPLPGRRAAGLLLIAHGGREVWFSPVPRLEGGQVPIVTDGVAVGDRGEALHFLGGPFIAGGLQHHGPGLVRDDEAAVEMAVAAQLAIAALAEAVEKMSR